MQSQKIGHVTFFWNGNRGGKFNKNLETYQEVRFKAARLLPGASLCASCAPMITEQSQT